MPVLFLVLVLLVHPQVEQLLHNTIQLYRDIFKFPLQERLSNVVELILVKLEIIKRMIVT